MDCICYYFLISSGARPEKKHKTGLAKVWQPEKADNSDVWAQFRDRDRVYTWLWRTKIPEPVSVMYDLGARGIWKAGTRLHDTSTERQILEKKFCTSTALQSLRKRVFEPTFFYSLKRRKDFRLKFICSIRKYELRFRTSGPFVLYTCILPRTLFW